MAPHIEIVEAPDGPGNRCAERASLTIRQGHLSNSLLLKGLDYAND